MFSIRAPGTAALIASTTCPDSASPHNAATAASAATPGAASTCASADGTALIRDPRHGPAPPRSARASRFGTTSRQPPEHSVPNTSNTDTSKLSDVDPSTRDNSPPGNAEAAQHASDTTPACSTTTPFGRPVDPDVYTTYATSPGTPATGRSSPPGPPASTPATAASSRTSTGSPPGSPAATAPLVSTATRPTGQHPRPRRVIQHQHRQPARQPRRHRPRRQHRHRPRLSQHEPDPVARIPRIHRHVPRTRLQHPQHRGDHGRRTRHRDRDQPPRTRTQAHQMPRQPVSPRVQLPVRQLQPAAHNSQSTRIPRSLLLEQPVQRHRRHRPRRVIPLPQQPPPLPGSHHLNPAPRPPPPPPHDTAETPKSGQTWH